MNKNNSILVILASLCFSSKHDKYAQFCLDQEANINTHMVLYIYIVLNFLSLLSVGENMKKSNYTKDF